MNPQATTVLERTGTFGNIPIPITMMNVPKITTATQTVLMPPVRIDAIEHLEDEFASVDEGKKIYPFIRQALEQGRKVQLSVKGLDVYRSFFDAAICKLYGDFSEETVDNDVEVVMDPRDFYELQDIKKIRKLFYYHRETFDQRMREFSPIIVFGEGNVPGDVLIPEGDKNSVDAKNICAFALDDDLARAITADELMVGVVEDLREMFRRGKQ